MGLAIILLILLIWAYIAIRIYNSAEHFNIDGVGSVKVVPIRLTFRDVNIYKLKRRLCKFNYSISYDVVRSGITPHCHVTIRPEHLYDKVALEAYLLGKTEAVKPEIKATITIVRIGHHSMTLHSKKFDACDYERVDSFVDELKVNGVMKRTTSGWCYTPDKLWGVNVIFEHDVNDAVRGLVELGPVKHRSYIYYKQDFSVESPNDWV